MNWKSSGIIIAGCMFIGMGIDRAYHLNNIGMFIGMGVGFLAGTAVSILSKNTNHGE